MKLVKCIVRPECVGLAVHAIEATGVSGVTVTEVRGRGEHTRPRAIWRGVPYDEFVQMAMIDVCTTEDLVDDVVRAVIDHTRTGEAGDGRVFVMSLEEGYSVRTRQPGRA